LQVAGLAGCAGEWGMDVKISDIAHFFRYRLENLFR
jgi:hypothetical protein